MGNTTNAVRAGDFSGERQEWGRTADVYRVFGIKRGTLYNLHDDGKVKGKVLRVRGKLTGVRLWDMDSIRQFINTQPDSFDGFKQKAPPVETGQNKYNGAAVKALME